MKRNVIGLFAAGTLGLAAAAPGDWLVLRDGSRVETSGPWEVKGRQVVFSRPGGMLAALRLADVDLAASEAATAESREPPAAESTAGSEPRKPVLRLTNEDLRPEDPDPEATEDDEAEGDGEIARSEDADQPVRLVSWDSREGTDLDALEVSGSIRNTGDDVAAVIRIEVTALDLEGNPVVGQAFLRSSSLVPGGRTTFRVLLPGVDVLQEDPTFKIESEGLSILGSGGAEGATEDTDADLEDADFEDADLEEDLEQEPPP